MSTVSTAFREMLLEVPPIACVAPAGVFDAYGWCESTQLGLRMPAEGFSTDETRCLTADNPPGMAFVFTSPCDFLPSELACLHLPKLSRPKERILAPYAIDDATDDLHALRITPSDVMCLATDSIAGLFWGLHDWAHFHNHGPFEVEHRPWNELQCDLAALSWLAKNRNTLSLSDTQLDEVITEWESVALSRFAENGQVPPAIGDLWRNILSA